MRAVLAAVALLLGVTTAPPAAATPPTSPAPPLPRAWIVVDADTGAVVQSGNARTPLPPASLGKVLTALVAVERLPADASVPVSPLAASMPPLKVGMHPGQVWPLPDVLRAVLLVSANDAAVALAERVSGSLAGFRAEMAAAASRLRLADTPVLADPSGLDDESAFPGGNSVSALALAIVTRAALAVPVIRRLVAEPEHRFRGVDGRDHRFRNHNPLLRTYPGANGVKTGYTRRAGHSLIGAGTRNGRTVIAVVLGATDPARSTSALLDRGFATPVGAQAGMDRLPPIGAAPYTRPVAAAAEARPAETVRRAPLVGPWPSIALLAVAAVAAALTRQASRGLAAPLPAVR